MKDQEPFVTLFWATFNQKDRALRTLSDAYALDYPKDRYEVIVIDDGSIDGTPAAFREAARDSPFRVELIAGVHQIDYHHSRLFNACIAEAHPGTEVFVQVDDVVLRTDFLRQHVKWHVLGQPYVVSGAKFEGPEETWDLNRCKRGSLAGPGGGPSLDVPYSAMWAASLSYSRLLADKASTSVHERPYDERMIGYGHHEIEFAYRLERAGGRLVYDPASGVFHPDHLPVAEKERGFDRDRVVAEGLARNATFIREKHGLAEISRW